MHQKRAPTSLLLTNMRAEDWLTRRCHKQLDDELAAQVGLVGSLGLGSAFGCCSF
jgi:hypothetical protein